ncbi:hypothetical protein VCHA53O463_490008 [Vibrio chagasii]|nr:hypothetical protein VCHA56P515_340016 [Vibrio chagasii]CAH7363155.1 hypothetical protein VCHA53O463_490008 [Vibrio chagasii]
MFIQYKTVKIYNPEPESLSDLGFSEIEISEIMLEVEKCQQEQQSQPSA